MKPASFIERSSCFSFMMDEEVVNLAKTGHTAAIEFLVSRYRPLVETKAKAYFVVGADREDVVQEGMIGLCKAIRDFQFDRLNRFRPFAELCVTRQIITAVKTATRQKHVPLNGYISLNQSAEVETMNTTFLVVLPDQDITTTTDGLPSFSIHEPLKESMNESLSELERGVLKCYLKGLTYREMSEELACHTKSIDNALQRVKKKMGVLLQE